MIKRILVPLDGSELSRGILHVARRLLRQQDAEVVLVSVLDPPPSRPDEGWDAEARARREQLRGLEAELRQAGVNASHVLTTGDPAAKILAAISLCEPQLVAMASHGRSGVQRLVRGSVAARVLQESTHPVLLANPRALGGSEQEPFRRILVPLDGSATAASVLDLVGAFACLHQAEVLLLEVENFGVENHPGGPLRTPEQVAATLEPWAERLRKCSGLTQVRCLGAQGNPVEEILSAATREKADLLVMSTHGRSGFSRWWSGSVAESVLREATCPLLVRRVRQADEPHPDPAELLGTRCRQEERPEGR